MKLYLEIPKNFHFNRTVNSHGWRSLAPFKYDETSGDLSYVFGGGDLKNPVAAIIGEEDGKLKIEISDGKISSKARAKILHDARHILRFDDDLNDFYRLIKKEKEFAWIAQQNAGRLLRSPTVFEDLVKTICTTNCSWALTKNMVNNLSRNWAKSQAVAANALFRPPKKWRKCRLIFIAMKSAPVIARRIFQILPKKWRAEN